MKEQIKTPEKQLRHKEIANLSDAEFKTLVSRMLAKMVEYGPKTEEEMKAMKSEIKENVQGTNSEGKEIGTEINDLEKKEERNITGKKGLERCIWSHERQGPPFKDYSTQQSYHLEWKGR